MREILPIMFTFILILAKANNYIIYFILSIFHLIFYKNNADGRGIKLLYR